MAPISTSRTYLFPGIDTAQPSYCFTSKVRCVMQTKQDASSELWFLRCQQLPQHSSPSSNLVSKANATPDDSKTKPAGSTVRTANYCNLQLSRAQPRNHFLYKFITRSTIMIAAQNGMLPNSAPIPLTTNANPPKISSNTRPIPTIHAAR